MKLESRYVVQADGKIYGIYKTEKYAQELYDKLRLKTLKFGTNKDLVALRMYGIVWEV